MQPASKKIRYDEELEDLKEDNPLNLKGAQLNLTHTDRYFYGLKSNETKSSDIETLLRTQNPISLCQNVINEVSDWNLNVNNVFFFSKLKTFFIIFIKNIFYLGF